MVATGANAQTKAVNDAVKAVNKAKAEADIRLEQEKVKDEITGKERAVLNIESKVEDVTQALLTMAKGSTRSKEVNELTKQIISEAVAEEYESLGITSNVDSLYIKEEVT